MSSVLLGLIEDVRKIVDPAPNEKLVCDNYLHVQIYRNDNELGCGTFVYFLDSDLHLAT